MIIGRNRIFENFQKQRSNGKIWEELEKNVKYNERERERKRERERERERAGRSMNYLTTFFSSH